jgi:hypothetical protein
MSSLSITALNAALGAYLREHKNVLISEMLVNESFDTRFEVWEDVKDEVPLPSLSITNIVKPADSVNFTPTANALAFGARILKARPMKVDLQIVPSDLEKTWLGTYRKRGSNAHDLPFEAYIMNYIIEKAHEDVHLNAVYKGVFNGAGLTPGDTMDGFNTLIAAEIVAGNIVPVVTGAITALNVEDKLLLVYDAIGEAYKAKPTQMKVNSTIFDWYVRFCRKTYGTAQDYNGPQTMLYGTQCTLLKEPGLGASQRVMCTPKANMVLGVDTIGDYSNIQTQIFDRTIKILMDFKGGVNFKEINARALAVNDQA